MQHGTSNMFSAQVIEDGEIGNCIDPNAKHDYKLLKIISNLMD